VKRVAILVMVVVVLLIITGGLTAQVASNGGNLSLPIIRTTDNPDASVFLMQPWKAEQLFLFVGFVLFNLIGIALTLALIFWWLNREVRRAKTQETARPAPVESGLNQPEQTQQLTS
jgi:hypothetical protein